MRVSILLCSISAKYWLILKYKVRRANLQLIKMGSNRKSYSYHKNLILNLIYAHWVNIKKEIRNKLVHKRRLQTVLPARFVANRRDVSFDRAGLMRLDWQFDRLVVQQNCSDLLLLRRYFCGELVPPFDSVTPVIMLWLMLVVEWLNRWSWVRKPTTMLENW